MMKRMNDYMENIEKLLKNSWESIDYYHGGSLQLGLDHPLEWHVSYETPTNKALVIVSRYPLNNLESSKSIAAVCQRRTDEKYYISFQLTEHLQEDVFISMCNNLIEYSSDSIGESDAVKKVGARYKQWKRLMERKNDIILSDEKRRGLIGELLYLNEMILSGKNICDAIAGWLGPEGADQDFMYEGIWHEVKTTSLSSDRVVIHSVEQLGKNGDFGELVIFRVDICAPEADSAITLRTLVNDTVKKLNGDSDSIEKFTNKLNSVGYIDLDVYDNYHYRFFRKDTYDVDESFPRLTRESIRSEIIKCEYAISIASIEKWKKV